MSKIAQSRMAIERGIDMDEAARLYFPRPSKVFAGFFNLSNKPQLDKITQSIGAPAAVQSRRDIFRAAHSVFAPKR